MGPVFSQLVRVIHESDVRVVCRMHSHSGKKCGQQWQHGGRARRQKKKGEKSLKKEQLQKSFKPKDSNCLGRIEKFWQHGDRQKTRGKVKNKKRKELFKCAR